MSLTRKPASWELLIVDDGRGFDVDRQKQRQAIGSGLAVCANVLLSPEAAWTLAASQAMERN